MTKVVCDACGVTIVECRRYRLEALAEFMRLSMSATCIAVNVSGSTQKGGRCHGITRQLVERIASDLMAHPAEIWPEVIDHDIEDHSVACEECGVLFMPKSKVQRFCCTRHARRNYERTRYESDPEFRAGRKANSARWWDANKENVAEDRRSDRGRRAIRIQQRRRYHTDPAAKAKRLADNRAWKARQRGEEAA